MDASRGVAGRRAGWLASRRPRGGAPPGPPSGSPGAGRFGMTGWGRRRGAGGWGKCRAGVRGLAGGPAAVCLVAAAGLVLGGATPQNGTLAAQGHQRGGHERVRLLAAALASGAWSGATGAWSGYVVK